MGLRAHLARWRALCAAGAVAVAAVWANPVAHAQTPPAPGSASGASSQAAAPLRVQLLWSHQAQFAGLYVAQARKYFEAEGLTVELIEGGEGINPIAELQAGRVDLALSWMSNAWARSNAQAPVVNVAQVFSGTFLAVVCRTSAGVRTPRELAGQRIGVWGVGDEVIVQEMLRRLDIPLDSVALQTQRPAAQDLISGELPCATAMTYNEYWHLLAAGLSPEDLVLFSPEDLGVFRMEDGLYVRADRLESPEFRDQVLRLTRALRRGWMSAKQEPTLALQMVLRQAPASDRDHQRHMLETLLAALPPEQRFGYFDLRRFEQVAQTLRQYSGHAQPEHPLWTHTVWNALWPQRVLNSATAHHVQRVFESPLWAAFVLFGTLAFAFSATLEAIERGYGLWGRLLIAMAASMGGGAIRDLLIGGNRLPFYFMSDAAYPVGIFLIVMASSWWVKPPSAPGQALPLARTRQWCETLGFALIAVNGAMVALMAQLAWFWAPFCAAISCTGGGLLQDVLMNREPSAFRGKLFEETAMVTALCLLVVLLVANHFEHSMGPVLASVVLALGLAVALQDWIRRGKPRLMPRSPA